MLAVSIEKKKQSVLKNYWFYQWLAISLWLKGPDVSPVNAWQNRIQIRSYIWSNSSIKMIFVEGCGFKEESIFILIRQKPLDYGNKNEGINPYMKFPVREINVVEYSQCPCCKPKTKFNSLSILQERKKLWNQRYELDRRSNFLSLNWDKFQARNPRKYFIRNSTDIINE